ncbi:MAG: hypothetical protein ACOX2F_08415 [bacterium]
MQSKALLFLLIFSLCSPLFGEEQKNEKTELALNGGIVLKASSLAGNKGFLSSNTDFAFIAGFKAALLIKKSWFVGGAGYILGNRIGHCGSKQLPATLANSDAPCYRLSDGSLNKGELSFGYGGVTVGYSFYIKDFFRIETGLLVGGGKFSNQNEEGKYFFSQSFFALEPEVDFLFVIARHFGISINLSYRLVAVTGKRGLYSTADLSGPTLGVDFRLGNF